MGSSCKSKHAKEQQQQSTKQQQCQKEFKNVLKKILEKMEEMRHTVAAAESDDDNKDETTATTITTRFWTPEKQQHDATMEPILPQLQTSTTKMQNLFSEPLLPTTKVTQLPRPYLGPIGPVTIDNNTLATIFSNFGVFPIYHKGHQSNTIEHVFQFAKNNKVYPANVYFIFKV